MSDAGARGGSQPDAGARGGPDPEVDEVSSAPPLPLLRVVNADATAEEIAALVAVFSALGSASERPAPRRTSDWASPARQVRRPLPHGAGGWRASGLPR